MVPWESTYKVPFRRVRIGIVAMAKQELLHNHSYAAALVIQHAKRLRSIMVPSVVCHLYHIYLHYCISQMIFRKMR
jgi:hypothetical protein